MKLLTKIWHSDQMEWFYDRYYDINHFVACIERFFYWGWNMRKSHDFDFGYMYDMMYLKMRRMDKCFTNKGHCVWNDDRNSTEYRKFRIVMECVRRLSEDDFCRYQYDTYYKKWGQPTMSSIMSRESRNPQRVAELKRIMKQAVVAEATCRDVAFGYISKYSRGWWD